MAAVAGIRKATATLGAATEDVVTLSAVSDGSNLGVRGEVVHHGDVTDVIYVRTDGTAATVAGDECDVVLASERLAIHIPTSGEVSVISAGTATYTVVAGAS